MARDAGDEAEGTREWRAEALFTKPIDFGALRNEIDTCVERAA